VGITGHDPSFPSLFSPEVGVGGMIHFLLCPALFLSLALALTLKHLLTKVRPSSIGGTRNYTSEIKTFIINKC